MKIEAIKFINNPSAHNLSMFYRFGTAISFTAHLFLLLLLLINGIGTKAGRLLNPEPEAPAIDPAEACAKKVRLFSDWFNVLQTLILIRKLKKKHQISSHLFFFIVSLFSHFYKPFLRSSNIISRKRLELLMFVTESKRFVMKSS